MHPLFVELFVDTVENEFQADEERRRARRTRRNRSRMAMTVRSRSSAPMPRGRPADSAGLRPRRDLVSAQARQLRAPGEGFWVFHGCFGVLAPLRGRADQSG